jgi:putative transport protein
MLFGKIKFGKFTFGVFGCLFVGLIVGWWIYRLASTFPSTAKLIELGLDWLTEEVK